MPTAPVFHDRAQLPVPTVTALAKRRKRSLRSLFAGGLLLVTGGCATSIITPELEQELGSHISAEVEQQIGLYDDPPLTRYLQNVGNRLVAALSASPYRFHFDIVDQGEPNAFASPGGYVYVSRGLLAQLNSEDELAGVLAHEISHVTQRHHAKQVGRSVRAGLMTLPGKAVAVVNESWGKSIMDAGKVYLASYSRVQESEADSYGMRLAASAGYDPLQLAAALEGIERSVQLVSGESHEASFFDSHPTTPTRVAEVNKLARGLSWQPLAPLATRDNLYELLDGLWWGEQNPQQGVFQDQTFLSSELEIGVTFPAQWETINTPIFVGAHEPQGNAYIAMGAGERVSNPDELTAALAEKLQQQAGISPAEQRSFEIDGWPASMVRYDDSTDDNKVSLFYLFVTTPGETFTLMAMGLEEYLPDLRATAMSFHRLSPQEKTSITGMRVRTVASRPGESLPQLSARAGNAWPLDLTAVINGADTAAPDTDGRLYKIMRTEAYVQP
jgi:predicted Zn-dependent protease